MIITTNKNVLFDYSNLKNKLSKCILFDFSTDEGFYKFKNYIKNTIKKNLGTTIELLGDYKEDFEQDFLIKVYNKINNKDFQKQKFVKNYMFEIFNHYKNQNGYYNKIEYIKIFGNLTKEENEKWNDENENKKIILPFEAENLKEYSCYNKNNEYSDIINYIKKYGIDLSEEDLNIIKDILLGNKKGFGKGKEKQLKNKMKKIMENYIKITMQ